MSVRTFHFVFGLKQQREPFHLAHYLTLASCAATHPDARIVVHLHHEPHGPHWDRILPRIERRRVEPVGWIRDHEAYFDHDEGRTIIGWDLDYAHQADVIRLQILLDEGGVYVDMDTLFIAPFPDRYDAVEFLIGAEDPSGYHDERVVDIPLCNAMLAARAGSGFAATWLARMREVFDGTWSRHSCQEAAVLADEGVWPVEVIGPEAHFSMPCTPTGLADLFERRIDVPADALSVHWWEHVWWSRLRTDFTTFHAGLLDEEYVAAGRTTFAVLAQPALDARW